MTCSNQSSVLLCCIFRVKMTWWKRKFTVLTTANYRSGTVSCSAQLFHQANSAPPPNAAEGFTMHLLKLHFRVFFFPQLFL